VPASAARRCATQSKAAAPACTSISPGHKPKPRRDANGDVLLAKNDMEAILHLQQAERVAPESIKYHIIARELVRELLRRSRKPSRSLTAIATRAGVLA
jgi:hypothetical protein